MERVRNRPKREITHSVIPLSELHQLKMLTVPLASEKQRAEQEERDRLKALSEDRVKHWPNTIEALRLKKEQDRRDRLAKEEEVKQKMDVEEAEFQEAQRKAAIERANLILYEQDDRIKTLTSKMLLSHVLEERKMQHAIADAKKQQEKDRDAHWHKILVEQLKKAKEQEEEKIAQMREKARYIQKMQKEQLEETKRRIIRHQEEEKAEARAIRAAAERAILEEMEEDRVRRQKARELATEYASLNVAMKSIKLVQAQKEAEEDARIEKFAKIKEEQMSERKRRADEKFERDMARRQNLIEKLSDHLAKIKAGNEERLQQQMANLERQKEEREADDKNKAIKMWCDIQQSRKRQLDQKERKKQQNDQEARAFRKHWSQAAEQMLVEDMENRQARRARNLRLQEFQKLQMHEKDAKAKAEIEQDKLEGEMMKRAMVEEEEMFQRYCETVMGEYSSKGRNLDTMRTIRHRGDVTI